MLPSLFWENMEVVKVTTEKLTRAHGITVYSKKTNRLFSTGGLTPDVRLKVGSVVSVFVSCNRIHRINSLDGKKRYFG